MTKKKSGKSVPSQGEISLDDLLVNIQKSLSRVSSRSSTIPEDQARSIIYGDIDFSIELKIDGEGDKLFVSKDGSVNLSMSGKISADIRNDEIELKKER